MPKLRNVIVALKHYCQHEHDCPKYKHPSGYAFEGGMFYEGPRYYKVKCECGLDEVLKEVRCG
jgi:hypothetical protein